MVIPMLYRRGVPSLSFAGEISSAYDVGESTLPPCNACSQVIRSPAVEQMPPAANGPVYTVVRNRAGAAAAMAVGAAPIGDLVAPPQYLGRGLRGRGEVRCGTFPALGSAVGFPTMAAGRQVPVLLYISNVPAGKTGG